MFNKDIFVVKASDKIDFVNTMENYKNWVYKYIEENKGITISQYLQDSDTQEKTIEEIFTRYNFLSSVQKTEAVNETYEFLIAEYQNFSNPFNQDPLYYEFIKSLKTESVIDERLKERYLKGFEHSGINLSKEDQLKLNELRQELSTLSMTFSKNLIDSKKEWSYVLTDDVKSTLSEKDLAYFKSIDNQLVLKFNQNDMGDIMTKSESDALKQIVYTASDYPGSPKSSFDNTLVTKRIHTLKQSIAKILGYSNYTALALEDRMAESYYTITSFLSRIEEKMKPLALIEYNQLNKFVENKFGVKDIPKWNRGYYANIKREELLKYEFNMERPYFKHEKVFKGVFSLVEKLFGFTFVKDEDAFVLPYADTECYRVYEGNVLKSYLIIDMFERELKNSGAWVQGLSSVTLNDVGLVVLCCNVNKKDIGMDIDEINTFLHEMGHAVHHFSSKVKYSNMSGTNGMARDAVEIPSQMLEQFAYDKKFLCEISGHVENDSTIPDEMLNSIIASKNYSIGSHYARQLVFAKFDINLYHDFEGDIAEFYKKIANDILPSKVNDDTNFTNTFSHIFAGGYSAGYYGYLWADIYSIDAFMHVLENQENNAKKFKTEFLEKGSSIEPLNLYNNFRGQEVSLDNFMKYYGVA